MAVSAQGALAGLPGGRPGHSTEMVMMRQTEVLIPPPPAQSQAAPANGRGGPKHP